MVLGDIYIYIWHVKNGVKATCFQTMKLQNEWSILLVFTHHWVIGRFALHHTSN